MESKTKNYIPVPSFKSVAFVFSAGAKSKRSYWIIKED
jgi:hypothetical protein